MKLGYKSNTFVLKLRLTVPSLIVPGLNGLKSTWKAGADGDRQTKIPSVLVQTETVRPGKIPV